ncbi:MAG: RNA methyltransferase [Bacilli bacterium]|nr:RNA methyltransferase [Bacilli bacterium]
MVIKSLENERIKNVLKLQKKKYRDLSKTYLIEGEHLIEEAYKISAVLEVYLLEDTPFSFDIPHTYVSYEVMKKLSMMDTPSTMIAVCCKKDFSDLKNEKALNKVLLLDEIQDPGNLGTIIRSSVAFGVDMVILSENTVDLYNPKVLRATQGMYCHIPIFSLNAKEAIDYFKKNQYIIYGTNVNNGVDVRELTSSQKEKFCLIMGNEGNGIRPEIQELCDQNLYIPMKEEVESLNVGIACSILLYELGR